VSKRAGPVGPAFLLGGNAVAVRITGQPDFPAAAVLRVARGATMRQACTAAGIDTGGDVVGIMASAFAI